LVLGKLIFLGDIRATLLKNQELKITLLHETQADNVKKILFAGQTKDLGFGPLGGFGTLPTPALQAFIIRNRLHAL